MLGKIVDDRTLIVASSDLSHYNSNATAQKLDERCVKAICDLDIDTMETQEACGRIPILNSISPLRVQMFDLNKIVPFKPILLVTERNENGENAPAQNRNANGRAASHTRHPIRLIF